MNEYADVSASALEFIQSCQTAILTLPGASPVRQLAEAWHCLRKFPSSETPADLALAVTGLFRLCLFVLRVLIAPVLDADSLRWQGDLTRVDVFWREFRAHCFEEHCSLSRIARNAGVSYFTLSRSLRMEGGSSFSTHLAGVRLCRGIILLKASSLRVKEISVAVGYGYTACLDRQFRRWLRVSPAVIRGARHPLRSAHAPQVNAQVRLRADAPLLEMADLTGVDAWTLLRECVNCPQHRDYDFAKACLQR